MNVPFVKIASMEFCKRFVLIAEAILKSVQFQPDVMVDVMSKIFTFLRSPQNLNKIIAALALFTACIWVHGLAAST